MAASSCVATTEHGGKKKLTRLGSFSSREVFCAWAKDSLLKLTTVETLMEVHQVDSLPAVLALRPQDITRLHLPIGQARLFEEAVEKLHIEYKYNEPRQSPAIKVDIEFPRYKTLLDDDSTKERRKTEDPAMNQDHTVFHEKRSSEAALCDEGNKKKLLTSEMDDESQTGCACERWLFVVIFMPVVLSLSLLGGIAWLLLWPFDRFCKAFSKVFTMSQTLLLLPLTTCRWAVHGQRSGDNLEQGEEQPPKYGGTDNVEMKKVSDD